MLVLSKPVGLPFGWSSLCFVPWDLSSVAPVSKHFVSATNNEAKRTLSLPSINAILSFRLTSQEGVKRGIKKENLYLRLCQLCCGFLKMTQLLSWHCQALQHSPELGFSTIDPFLQGDHSALQLHICSFCLLELWGWKMHKCWYCIHFCCLFQFHRRECQLLA